MTNRNSFASVANGNGRPNVESLRLDEDAIRWGEDGLLGITDRECRLCFALALWNGKDRRGGGIFGLPQQ